MALPRDPASPVVEAYIQCVARAVAQSGIRPGGRSESGRLPEGDLGEHPRKTGGPPRCPGAPAENSVTAIGLGMYQDRAATLRTMRGPR